MVNLHNKVQVPHWDEPEDDFKKLSWICHIPLCDFGCYLYIWDRNCESYDLIFIPFGCFLVIRSDVLNGGWVGGSGNISLHLALVYQLQSKLSYPGKGFDKWRNNPVMQVDCSKFIDLFHNDKDTNQSFNNKMYAMKATRFMGNKLSFTKLPKGSKNK